jgi:2-isopropylmalate synthase
VRHQRRHCCRGSPTPVADVVAVTGARLGIHCHNDTGLRVGQLARRGRRGAVHVSGHAQRLRRADRQRRPAHRRREPRTEARAARAARGRLADAARIAHARQRDHELSPPYSRQPYVARAPSPPRQVCTPVRSKVDPDLYQHNDPTRVGTTMRMLVSDMAGRGVHRAQWGRELGFRPVVRVGRRSGAATRVTNRVEGPGRRGVHLERRTPRSSSSCARRSTGRGRPTSTSRAGG